jgi:predicted nuclease with TOPRIM domain
MIKEENKVVKDIITGNAVPKSMSLIELEKNYALLAEMFARLLDRIKTIEDDLDKLEEKVALLLMERESKKNNKKNNKEIL